MIYRVLDPDSGVELPLDLPTRRATLSISARAGETGCSICCPRTHITRRAEHYTLQWGAMIAFQDFAKQNPVAMMATPGKQLGWQTFFEEVREEARHRTLRVLDAACGCGAIMDELFRAPVPEGIRYVGTDIHGALSTIKRPIGASAEQTAFLRWDIGRRLPIRDKFDVVICRASIHHTEAPRATFANLASMLTPRGRIAISAYARKGNLREAVDDGVRRAIGSMAPDEAFAVGREFALLGRALQRVGEKVDIEDDLDWLGIPAGNYNVQDLIYDHILKCWWNDAFGEKYSTVVNFDWYHPTYAYRYGLEEIAAWFVENGIEIKATATTKAQHYVEGSVGPHYMQSGPSGGFSGVTA